MNVNSLEFNFADFELGTLLQYTAKMFTWYCRMLNVREYLSWQFGFVRHSRYLNLANVTSGVVFSYASIIFGEFYFGKCKEPHELA